MLFRSIQGTQSLVAHSFLGVRDLPLRAITRITPQATPQPQAGVRSSTASHGWPSPPAETARLNMCRSWSRYTCSSSTSARGSEPPSMQNPRSARRQRLQSRGVPRRTHVLDIARVCVCMRSPPGAVKDSTGVASSPGSHVEATRAHAFCMASPRHSVSTGARLMESSDKLSVSLPSVRSSPASAEEAYARGMQASHGHWVPTHTLYPRLAQLPDDERSRR